MWNTVEFKNIAIAIGASSHGQMVCQFLRCTTIAAATITTAVMARMYSYRLPSGKRFAASPRVMKDATCSTMPNQISACVMFAHLRAPATRRSYSAWSKESEGTSISSEPPPAPTATF